MISYYCLILTDNAVEQASSNDNYTYKPLQPSVNQDRRTASNDYYPPTDDHMQQSINSRISYTTISQRSASLLTNGGQDTPEFENNDPLLNQSQDTLPAPPQVPLPAPRPVVLAQAVPIQADAHYNGYVQTKRKSISLATIICIVILISVIIIILSLFGSIASISVYSENNKVENSEYNINTQRLENRNERYGIEKGSVNAYIYDTVCLESDGDDDDATLILASDLHIENKSESIGESNLTNGTGLNEVYSYRHFSYIAYITADIGFSFNFIMNQTDEQGTTTSTVCNKTITITNSSAYTLTCSSNVSGYYSAYTTVLNGTNGKISFNVSYDTININLYNNSNSKLCVIDKDTKKCSIHTVKHGYNRVIVGFNTQQNAVTLKYHKTDLILGVPLPVAAILIIIFLVFCIVMWKCSTTCNKSKPTEAENRDGRDDVVHKDIERKSLVA